MEKKFDTPERELIFGLQQSGIRIKVLAAYCREKGIWGCYKPRERVIVLGGTYEGSPEYTSCLWHEATHALQYCMADGEPLGFPPTNKGLAALWGSGGTREYRESVLETEAYSVETSKTYRKILLDVIRGDIFYLDIEDECKARLEVI